MQPDTLQTLNIRPRANANAKANTGASPKQNSLHF